MKLYHSPTSPYVRKVMVVLHETGQLGDVELVTTSGTPLDPAEGFAAVNPLSKVPALVTEDGQAIYDSRILCRYLDARANARLYGSDDTWRIQTLEATGEGVIDAALLMAYEWRLRPEEIRFEAWVEGQWVKIAQALDVIERDYMDLMNAPLNAGQIAVACALGYLDLRNADRNWRAGRPDLAAWFEAFSARPSMLATVPG
ncbi:glutathione S-transferase [Halocynthiibacter styelae]|uniref:Glutathione S-transferase n=1 Tax=Halocynthiibacter styelae TaxID=2761955 RepID=A0A8J7LKX0_9RHOB|nr:glutathione S-transferase [Paenihalocynthiibacter styelae]MBI1494810.1 glutathione S-transferase [Paenihalocynthiibacter styelae]